MLTKNSVIGGLVAGLIALGMITKAESDAAQVNEARAAAAEEAYKHPQTVLKTHNVITEGPIRTITKVVQLPGRTETITETIHDPVIIVADRDADSTPVPLAKIDPIVKSENRLWLGGGVHESRLMLDPANFHPADVSGFIGYSFYNRVQVATTLRGDLKEGFAYVAVGF